MNVIALASLAAIPVTAGVFATWVWAKRRQTALIIQRLERLAQQTQLDTEPLTLIKPPETSFADLLGSWAEDLALSRTLRGWLAEAGLERRVATIVWVETALLMVPVLAVTLFGANPVFSAIGGLLLLACPIVWLKLRADSRRAKMSEQLPDAIDLMVSVLRSGHSVPQAVKAVAGEVPSPCGDEFAEILHRVNLGQSLAESLSTSAQRFRSFELDLIRRAVSIQSEVGGSLAELLDNTNATLRDRLKLARHLKVITAQSRLSAYIVGLLPIGVGIALNTLSPGYMQILTTDKDGQLLLTAAVFLEIVGLFVMHRMSTIKA